MDYSNNNTESRKNKHLNFAECMTIELSLKDGFSPYNISKELERPINTILNEIRRGFKLLECSDFINYTVDKIKNDSWSPDACVAEAIANSKFERSQMVSTKTLYNYIDLGLLSIKNVDLPMKLRRNTKPTRIKEHKKKLGTSITERPNDINNRTEFGHWDIDTVIGETI